MKWVEIQSKHPNSWTLVEATHAHSENNMRILDELEIIGVFEESPGALKQYKAEHHNNPMRELFVLHTSREKIDVEERRWAGIRA